MSALGLPALKARLDSWVTVFYDDDARIEDLVVTNDHDGSAFRFVVAVRGAVFDELTMRVAPADFGAGGRAPDLLRQVTVLQALTVTDLPIPELRWWDDDERWFGAPFVMLSQVVGSKPDLIDPTRTIGRSRDEGAEAARLGQLLGRAVDALAAIHGLPWRRLMPDSEPRELLDELRWWTVTQASSIPGDSPRPQDTDELIRCLIDTIPEVPEIGLCHGDYRLGNLLFADEQLTGVVHWDWGGVGAQLLDVGWLLASHDPYFWAARADVSPCDFAEQMARYSTGVGRGVTTDDVGWFRAFAGLRIGLTGRSAHACTRALDLLDRVR